MADGTCGTAWLQQFPVDPVLSLLCTVVLKSVTSAGTRTCDSTHVRLLTQAACGHRPWLDLLGRGLTLDI